MTPDEIRKDFTYKFGNELMEPGTFDRILFYVMNAVKKEGQAYGGCIICYGKGYSTERTGGLKVSADFESDEEYFIHGKMQMNYCRCDRGAALKRLLQKPTV